MKDFREQNYYELLEVPLHASQQEIESGYERVRRIFGSRSLVTYALFTPEELVLLRRRIEEAFKVLSDPERRQLYDQELQRLEGSGWQAPASGEAEAAGEQRPEATAQQPLPLTRQPRDPTPVPESPEENAAEPVPEPLPRAQVRQEPAAAQAREVRAAQEEKPATGGEPPPELGPDTEVDGELLARARRHRGLTLEQIADTTKISIYYLRNLEKEDFTNLPARVYVRGYLKQIAVLLGLDPTLVVDGYLKRMSSGD